MSKHGDFKAVEASRPAFDTSLQFRHTQTPHPEWQPGSSSASQSSNSKSHIEIDPYEEGRPVGLNYKLLISAIIPRPIGFLSTRSVDGASTNLAPFSYTQVFNHDPPVFVVGFSGGLASAKDSLRNLADSQEAVLNMVSEDFVEAMNITSTNAPYGVSEWVLAGLTPASCSVVKASRVKEAVFSVECKLIETKEIHSRASPGKVSGTLAILEGVKFWAREDAINGEKSQLDPAVLKPVSRLGGITYGRTLEAFEIPRPDFSQFEDRSDLIKPKLDSQ